MIAYKCIFLDVASNSFSTCLLFDLNDTKITNDA